VFANDFQHVCTIGLQHNQVTSGFGFEFVEHGEFLFFGEACPAW
jgi:hypothetical protein